MSSIQSGGVSPAVLPLKQIRFVNNEGQPPAKRRRITAACRTCRKRKTRCDGRRPICSTCKDHNHVCLGYADGADSQAGPRELGKHGTHDEEDHYSDEEEKDNSSGSFAQRSPHRAENKVECLHGSALETPNSRGFERIDPSMAKEEYQGISTFPDNCSATFDATPPVQVESHRVPYFRYFGPTAIVPGYKAMVVAVPSREVKRSTAPTPAPSSGSGGHSGGSVSGGRPTSQASSEPRSRIETPTYDPDPENQVPVNRLIIHLVEVFFLHQGCNYPFLNQKKFVAMVEEKRVDAILVNAVCALAARFSDHPLLTISRDRNISKSEYGSVFASRAKAAVVNTFPCPSVAAVQACLLLAYEGFGSDEDSALWMYLGCAIRMAQDLGLQKLDRVKDQTKKYQKSSSPDGRRKSTFDLKMGSRTAEGDETEKEHIDTLWAVFILDRVISSGTGRAVTLRDEEFDLAFPELISDVETGWPAPFPVLVQIIHLYGRVSDLINNIRSLKDMTSEKMEGLSKFEKKLTAIYQKLDHRLTFNAPNFQHYVKAGQGTNFILLHFWFHTLIMLLHQPTLLHSFEGRIQQLLPNSRELSMSSAKTIADILAFAELIDPRSFIANPFTSQPIYIAACAFLMESVAHSSQPTSRDASPPKSGNQPAPASNIQESSGKTDEPKKAVKKEKYSLLATAANQNYQICYKALEQLEKYWAGTRYILTALDQKAKGIWDPETYTTEEMESTKRKAETQMHSWRNKIPSSFHNAAGSPKNFSGVLSPITDSASPMGSRMTIDPSQALGWSLSGITNSPNSNLAFLFQPVGAGGDQPPNPRPSTAGTLIYDPIRQSVPEANSNVQPINSMSYNPPYLHHRNSSSNSSPSNARGMLPPGPNYNSPITKSDTSDAEMLLNLTSPYSKSLSTSGSLGHIPQYNASYERSTGLQGVTTPSQRRDGKSSVQANNSPTAAYDFGNTSMNGSPYSGISRGGYTALSGYGNGGGIGMGMAGKMMITSQDIDMSALGGDMMPWLQDYLPSDMMNFFDNNSCSTGNGGSG